MNWQTKEVLNWLDEMKISSLLREDIETLQELVESSLLVKQVNNPSSYLINFAVTEFLKNVQWEELVLNPNAWDDDYLEE